MTKDIYQKLANEYSVVKKLPGIESRIIIPLIYEGRILVYRGRMLLPMSPFEQSKDTYSNYGRTLSLHSEMQATLSVLLKLILSDYHKNSDPKYGSFYHVESTTLSMNFDQIIKSLISSLHYELSYGKPGGIKEFLNITAQDLSKLKGKLIRSAHIRNLLAHSDIGGIYSNKYVQIRSQSSEDKMVSPSYISYTENDSQIILDDMKKLRNEINVVFERLMIYLTPSRPLSNNKANILAKP